MRVRFNSKNESMSIIVTSASHIATLLSVGGTLRDDRPEVAGLHAVGVGDRDDRRADVVADEREALVHADRG